MIRELAPAKVNLVLHVGPRRPDGLHEICSLFASLELADLVEVELRRETARDGDHVDCPGVPTRNLAHAALAAYRAAAPEGLAQLAVRIDKRIPVAAGLGGGSADAAAVLRAAAALAAQPLGAARLREIGMKVGADVPSQVGPAHALVTGAGEGVEAVSLPPLPLVLVPQREGLSTARVYAEADRMGVRDRLDPEPLRELLREPSPDRLLAALENDLEAPGLALRPELAAIAERLRAAGGRGTVLSGSGPTMVGAFDDYDAAGAAAAAIEGAIATRLRERPSARVLPDLAPAR